MYKDKNYNLENNLYEAIEDEAELMKICGGESPAIHFINSVVEVIKSIGKGN